MESSAKRARYWRANLRLLAVLLLIWFGASYGLGILFVEPLNQFHIGGFPLGFWFSQQGSIYVFIVLIFVYARTMDRIDRDYKRE
jgi:putative solute:sodium symporter small subunit